MQRNIEGISYRWVGTMSARWMAEALAAGYSTPTRLIEVGPGFGWQVWVQEVVI